MSAQPIDVPEVPALRALLDRHFEPRELARVLGLDDPAAVALARRALHPPLADFLARPGKELRARLVEHAYAIAIDVGPACACARLPEELPLLVEMLHAGSLVIDDVEDDARTRRGAPALHRAHGVPVAINAGNWLYFWPLQLLGRIGLDPCTAAAIHRRTTTTLMRCHHGQALDLGVRVHDVPQSEVAGAVLATTQLKTGSLFELAAATGAIAAHAPPAIERALATFGREVGIVLQMLDDLGSVTAKARREKGEEDLVGARLTWPWAWLAETLEPSRFAELVEQLRRVAEDGESCGPLVEALDGALDANLRRRPRARLDRAIANLRAVAGDRASVDRLIRDVRTLERAHG